jgi:prepilin-type N-terminal cleavage/methylation domain-containing protein
MSIQHSRRAFTLVELLVVIGIIALLISVLLPALSRARKSAAAVKCSASLREIGNALRMYSIDSKGWYPVAKLTITAGSYSLNTTSHGVSTPPYWFNFLQQYVTKANVGYSVATAGDQHNAQRSIFWACPEWQGYAAATAAGVSTVQPGFGMSGWPTFNPGYPKTVSSFPPSDAMVAATNPECNVIADYNSGKWTKGNFHKEKVWTRNGTNRIVVADSRFWLVETQKLPAGPGNSVVYPP